MALGLEVLSRYKHMLLAPGVEKLPIGRAGSSRDFLHLVPKGLRGISPSPGGAASSFPHRRNFLN